MISMLLATFSNVKPVWELLIRLQHGKDRRQNVRAPKGTVVYPDQTVLCDFTVWGIAFICHLDAVAAAGEAVIFLAHQ